MNAVNYDRMMQETIRDNEGKRLLLHCCCAPCASHCLFETAERMEVTVFFYNPNLDCEAEYLLRKRELVRFLEETGLARMRDCDYLPEEFAAAARGLEGEPEGGARCRNCFELRLRRTAREARENAFDFFATTLTLSPLKNARLINEIGFSLQESEGVSYLPSDFKKRGGYSDSVRLSREFGLYRQNYCGCTFSKTARKREQKGVGQNIQGSSKTLL